MPEMPSTMPDRIDRLTQKEREALRLVLSHGSFREIAEELGVSESAIRERIQNAAKKLGVRGRHAAARLLLAAEQSHPSRAMTGAPKQQVVDPDLLIPNEAYQVAPSAQVMRDQRHVDPRSDDPLRGRLMQLLEGGGEGNELTVKMRIMRIGFWMIIGITLFCLLGAVLQEIGQAGRAHRTAERTSI